MKKGQGTGAGAGKSKGKSAMKAPGNGAKSGKKVKLNH
jgi:hypothetical protein